MRRITLMTDEKQDCPKCQQECWRDEVDVGVGWIYGPWGCGNCGWSEDPEYDLSNGQNATDGLGGKKDQWGGYWPSTEPINEKELPF